MTSSALFSRSSLSARACESRMMVEGRAKETSAASLSTLNLVASSLVPFSMASDIRYAEVHSALVPSMHVQ